MTLLSRCVWCLSYSNGTSGVEGSLLWLLNDSCGQMVHLAQYVFTPMALSPSSLKKPLFNAACYWCEASIGTFKNVTLNVCGESVVAGIAGWNSCMGLCPFGVNPENLWNGFCGFRSQFVYVCVWKDPV